MHSRGRHSHNHGRHHGHGHGHSVHSHHGHGVEEHGGRVSAQSLVPTSLSAASSRAHSSNEGHLLWVFEETERLELEREAGGLGPASEAYETPRKKVGSSAVRITSAQGKEESLEWLAASPVVQTGGGSPMPGMASAGKEEVEDGEDELEGEAEHASTEWKGLNMSHMGLRHLSPSLVVFPHLVELDLSHNAIQTLSPHVFYGLSELKVLNLSNNMLTNLQDGWVELTSLKVLDLAQNHIQFVPFDLGSLYNLRSLNLMSNPVSNVAGELLAKTDASIVKYLRDVAPPPPAPPLRKLVTSPSVPAPASDNHCAFTVFCFNVLSDAYATGQMYPHTPTWALEWEFRKALILSELLNTQADILCLQEIQSREFAEWLEPELMAYGYTGVFKAKSRARTMRKEKAVLVDGCAIFYRSSKFVLISSDDVEFSARAMAESSLRASEESFNRLLQRDNVALILVLRTIADGHTFVVANTHLHFDPRFSDVKIVQCQMLLEATATKVEEVEAELGVRPDAIVCGDFNSLPDSGVYRLLQTGYLPSNAEDLLGFSYGALSSSGVRHRLALQSVYAAILGRELEFTNYTPLFKGTIDYIWVSNSLVVEAVLEGLSPADARKGIALPNAHHPSDHISIMCKVRKE